MKRLTLILTVIPNSKRNTVVVLVMVTTPLTVIAKSVSNINNNNTQRQARGINRHDKSTVVVVEGTRTQVMEDSSCNSICMICNNESVSLSVGDDVDAILFCNMNKPTGHIIRKGSCFIYIYVCNMCSCICICVSNNPYWTFWRWETR